MRLHLPICLLFAVLACYVSSSPAQARKWTDPDQGAVALGGDVCALYATDVCQEATPNDLAYSITITQGKEDQDIIAIDQTNTNGEVALKVGVAEDCADEIKASLTGASGATVAGDIYLEIDSTGKLWSGSIVGVSNSSVSVGTGDSLGAVTVLVDGGSFSGTMIMAGDSDASSNGSIAGGAKLTIADGTFSAPIYAGGAGGTINNGTDLYIKAGSFSNIVSAGGTGGIINADQETFVGVSMLIEDGEFHNVVSAAGDSTVNGAVEFSIHGGIFTSNVVGVSKGTVTGDILAIIEGGTFTSTLSAGSNNGSSTVDGNINLYLLGGTFEGVIEGAGFTSLTGDVNICIAGGTYTGCSGIYAMDSGNINDLASTANVSVEINGDVLNGWKGVLDGGTYADDAKPTGTRTLSLYDIDDKQVGDLSGITLSDFDVIDVEGTVTLGNNISGVSKAINVAEQAALTVVTTDAVSTSSSLSIAEGGSVVISNAADLTIGDDVNADETATLTKKGCGTLKFASGGFNEIGAFDIQEGIVEISNSLYATSVNLGTGTTLKLDNDYGTSSYAATVLQVDSLSGSGLITAKGSGYSPEVVFRGPETCTFDGTFEGISLNKQGSRQSILVLTADNKDVERLTIISGAVQLGNGGTTGSWNSDVVASVSCALIIDRSDDVTLCSADPTNDLCQSLTLYGQLIQQGKGTLTVGSLKDSTGILFADKDSSLVFTDATGFVGAIWTETGADVTIGGEWNVSSDTSILRDSTVIMSPDASIVVGSTAENSESVESEIDGKLVLSSDTTMTVNSESALALVGEVAYADSATTTPIITKEGTGDLIVGHDNKLSEVKLNNGGLVIAYSTTEIETLTTEGTEKTKLEVADEGTLTLTAATTELKNVTLTGEGVLNVAKNTTVTVADSSAFTGVNVDTVQGGTLELNNAQNTVKSINGDGTIKLTGDNGTKLAVTGNSQFAGTLDGAGTLSVEGGSSLLDTEGNRDIALEVHAAEVKLGSTVASYKGVTIDNGGSLILPLPTGGSSATGQVALRAASDSSDAQLNVASDGFTLASGSSLTLTVDAPTFASLEAIDPIVASEGDISLASGSTVVIANQSSLALTEVDSFKVTLMTSEGTATADGVNLVMGDKMFNVLYDAQLTVEGGSNVVLVGTQVKDNAFNPSCLPVNARAGAGLLWNVRFAAVADSSSLMGRVFEAAIDQKLAGDTSTLSKTLAAVAGSTINSAGTAQRDALQDQLETIRDRALTNSTDGSQLGHHFWIEGNGGYNHVRTQSDKGGYKLSTWGATVGADMEVNKDLTLGLAFTANYGDLRATAADRTTGDLDNYFLNLFGHYQSGAWGHTLVLTGVSTDADLDRSVDYGAGSYKAHGSADGYGIGALYEVSYDFKLNDKGTSILQPLFDASIVHTSLDSYTETGASNAGLNVGKQEWTTGTLAVGARWSGTFGTQKIGKTLFGELRATVGQDLGDKQGKTGVSLIGAPRFSQNVYGAKQGATSFQLSGGISTNIGQNGTIYANAGAEFRNDANSVHGNVGYRYAF